MVTGENLQHRENDFLSGEGHCKSLIRSINWTASDLGKTEDWPQSLKTTLSIILNAKFPMFLFWGPSYIQFYNDAFRPALGIQDQYAEVMGKSGTTLCVENGPVLKGAVDRVFHSGEAFSSDDQLIQLSTNGKMQNACWTFCYSPLTDETGYTAGVFISCFDTTSKVDCLDKIAEANETEVINILESHLAVSNAEERLRLATEATGIGSWDIDLCLNTIIYTPTLMGLFGCEKDAILNLQEINEIVHPEDRELVDNAFEHAKTTGYYHYEARLLWPDNSIHWISTNGRVIFDENNLPIRLLGTTIDITETKIEQMEKNDFIAIASHELKTPLTSIKAYIQMLKSGRRLDEPGYVVNLASRAENQVNKMTKLIYSFLDMSRIESGHIDLCIEPFMMDELITEVIKDYRIHTSSHTVIFNPGITEMIDGDRSRICQVIDNLVSNAIKYSPLSKVIEISSAIVGEEAIVAIKDYGIGIDLKHQTKVFERFYRADDQKARNASGFGIGLYLSADILKRHNGGIWINSVPGHGTTFYFSLPLERS